VPRVGSGEPVLPVTGSLCARKLPRGHDQPALITDHRSPITDHGSRITDRELSLAPGTPFASECKPSSPLPR